MLESLKDLYITYPFLPVADPPAFFKQVKDVRLVVELPAVDLLLGYKNDRNGNYIRVWFTGFVSGKATFRISCQQVSDTDIVISAPLYPWNGDSETATQPPVQSYMLCDQSLIDNPPAFVEGTAYELNPEVLLLMQIAPRLAGMSSTIKAANGHNVLVSVANNTLSFYGAPDTGAGIYPINEPFALDAEYQAKGAISINGLSGSVRIDPTFPVRIDLQGSTLSVTMEPGVTR